LGSSNTSPRANASKPPGAGRVRPLGSSGCAFVCVCRRAVQCISIEPIHIPFARRRIQPTWSTDGHVGRLHAGVRTEKLPMHKAALTVNRIPKASARIQQLFSTSPSPPGGFGGRTMANGGQKCTAPHPQNRGKLANWQTKFFFGRKFCRRLPLRCQLSLPTVANTVANWQTQ
jgi:hypothetical protein